MQMHSGTRALMVLAASMLMAAGCGVANPFAPSNAAVRDNANQARLLKWAQCMRQHGVNVADPQNGTIRIQATGGPDGSGQQQLQAATEACKQYQPNGGQSSGPPSQQALDSATKFAQCMRDHGIPMQDPQVSGGGIRIGGGGGPNAIDPNSDQFKQAQQACQRFMPTPPSGAKSGGS
jgi:hypothetical protein